MQNIFLPEKLFLIIALIFGILLTVLTPPYQIPDEPQHFYRALSITEKRIISLKINDNTGNYLPADLDEIHEKYVPIIKNLDKKTSFDDFKKSLAFKYNKNKQMFFNFPNTALYSPVCYIPQIIGIIISKLFTNSLVAILLFGRLFSLFFFIAMGYLSIKTIPILKWGIFLVLLTPMNLIIASGFSADTVLFCLSIFYFAKILQYYFTEKTLKTKEIICLTIIALLIALCKQSFLFTLFIFIIPAKRFGSNPALKIATIIIPALTASIIWALMVKNIYIPLNNADAIGQISYIIHHPVEYLTVLFKPTFDSLIILFEAICIMGWLEMSVPKYYYFIYIVLFILNAILITDTNDLKIKIQTNIKFIILALLNYIAISTLLYLSWAPPGNFYPTMVLQGRYFSILLLPLMTIFYATTNYTNNKLKQTLNITTVLFIIAILTQVTHTIIIRYY